MLVSLEMVRDELIDLRDNTLRNRRIQPQEKLRNTAIEKVHHLINNLIETIEAEKATMPMDLPKPPAKKTA
jgi:hypothetical protein